MSAGRRAPRGAPAVSGLAGLLLLLAVACGGQPAHQGAPAPLPDAGPLAGWHPEGALETVTGDGLYQRVDGGAELFLEAGFERLLVRDYTGGGEEIEAELFVLGSSAAAHRVWEHEGGGAASLPGLPGPARADRYQLRALLGRCYLVIDNLSGGDAARACRRVAARDRRNREDRARRKCARIDRSHGERVPRVRGGHNGVDGEWLHPGQGSLFPQGHGRPGLAHHGRV